MSEPVFRFAPSPNGEMHLGHAYSAVTAYGMAQQFRGRFLLRIEDIDISRSRQPYIDQIYDDLAWLGIAWEAPVRRQSEHFADYRAASERLEAMGLLYPCFASRREIGEAVARLPDGAPLDPDGVPLYPGLQRGLTGAEIESRMAEGNRPAYRIDMANAMRQAELSGMGPPGRALEIANFDGTGKVSVRRARPERWGDAIIVRKDVPTSYHLAVVVDDAIQGVTHVVRGMDLEAATDLHRLLQVLLDLPAPLYHHHELIKDRDGRKLSKRFRDRSLKSLREAGYGRQDIFRMIGLPAPF